MLLTPLSSSAPRAKRSPHIAPAPPRLMPADYICMLIGFLFALAAGLYLGHHRIFWEDEMLGWMMVTDPSFHHMLRAWRMGADGGGIAFYLTARAWLDVFGPSETAYRMYSAVCFGAAFVLNWSTARRFYGTWVVAFALFNTYYCCPPIVLHTAEGRFYGLLMVSTAWCVWLAVRLSEIPTSLPSRYYIFVFAAHALLTTSHVLGIVYSFFVVAAMVALDLLQGRLRPLLYGSAASAWLLLMAELPGIRASAQVGKPWFWTVQPGIIGLFGPLTGYSGEIAIVMGALLICLALSWRNIDESLHQLRIAFHKRLPIYVIIAALALAAVAFLLEGFVGPSLFIHRYLIPTFVGTVLLNAEMMELVEWRAILPESLGVAARAQRKLLWSLAGLMVAMICFSVFFRMPYFISSNIDYTDRLSAMLPTDRPVLVDDGFTFTEMIGRHHDEAGVKYLYPLDWSQTVSRFAPRVEVAEYHLMENWRRVGYFSGSIVDLDSFLSNTPNFIVLDTEVKRGAPAPPFIGNPLPLRFSKTAGYTVTRYAALNRGRGMVTTAWLVAHDPKTTGMPIECAAPAE